MKPRLLLLAPALILACGTHEPELVADPRTLHFTPAHPELPLRLIHHGSEPLALSRIRIDHRDRDWSAFTITDAALPRQLAPGGEAVLHLRVDVDHFKPADPHDLHRSGEAALTLLAGGAPQRVALRFAADTTPPAWTLVRLAVLAALAGALALLARRVRLPWTLALPALAAVLIAPLGPGLCWDLGAVLGPGDLLQCADGRGGAALQILPHPDGLGLLLAVLLFSACGRISGAVAPLPRALGLAVAVLAFIVAHGLDPQAVVQAQAGMRWGLWMQPFAAAALAFAAASEVHAARISGSSHIIAFGLAALWTTLCLGGGSVPTAALALPHAAVVALGLGLWLAKVAVLTVLLPRLAPPTWARRAILPLALVQIFLTVVVLRGAS